MAATDRERLNPETPAGGASGCEALPEVDVVIVNFNAGETLEACLESVHSQRGRVFITLVDNASTDRSVAVADAGKNRSEYLNLQINKENIGFARAVNQAVRSLHGNRPYLLILNPDCELGPDCLHRLVEALELDPESALAAPMVAAPDGSPMRATLRRFPDPWKSFVTFSGLWRLGHRSPLFRGVEGDASLPAETTVAEAVSGACMLVRRREFMKLGGLDEAYGLHCEDLDLMYRLRRSGFHCLFVPHARAVHRQGVSSRSRPFWVHWQKHRGMQRFFGKFQAASYPMPVRWSVIAGIWCRFALTLPLAWLR